MLNFKLNIIFKYHNYVNIKDIKEIMILDIGTYNHTTI